MSKKIITGLCTLILLLFFCIPAESKNNGTDFITEPEVLTAFTELKEYINEMDNNDLSKGQKNSFMKKLNNAERKYTDGQPCMAAHILKAFLNEAQALINGNKKGKSGKEAIGEDLRNRGWDLLYTLMASLPPGTCGDEYSGFGEEHEMEILESNNLHHVATSAFGQPKLQTVKVEGETYTQLIVPGLEAGPCGGEPGKPSVKMHYELLAIPLGSTPVLHILSSESIEFKGVNLIPFQASALDNSYDVYDGDEEGPPPPEAFMDPPFIKDEEAYQVDAFLPANLVTVKPVGRMRDLELVVVSVASAQYNPVEKITRQVKTVSWEVEFTGGSGEFATPKTKNPFEEYNYKSLMEATLVNGPYLFEYLPKWEWPPIQPICWGEELMIITHPDFLTAANDLETWKEDKGIITNVYQTGTPPGGIGTTSRGNKRFH